ncbi:DUF87 domain-containing protein [Candidatus Microgenomates bacterium]|nr:DUF87 domain-containing protein [Candidatus Microgenomates bacterium]
MGGLITVISIFLAIGLIFLIVGFFVWRRVLRFAKGIERGIKMVPILIHLPPPSDDTETGARDERDVIQEQISQAEVLYNLIAGTFKKGFKSRFYGQRHLAFEIIAVEGLIKFFASVPVALVPVIEQAILTAYPTANLEEVEEHNIFNPTGKISATIGGEIVLKEEYSYPIATFTQLKRDAIQALINAMMSFAPGDGAGAQILLRPAFSGWTKAAKGLAEKKRKGKGKGGMDVKEVLQAPFKVPEQKKDQAPTDKQLSNLEQSIVDAIEEKTRYPGFEVLIRLVASSNTASRSQAILHNLVAAFALFDAPGLNGFKFTPAKDIENFVTAFIFRFFPPEVNRNVLNSIELATLFHLPDEQFTHTAQVERQQSKQVEAPSKMPEGGLLLGHNLFRGSRKEVRLSDEDRRRHVYIVGQTGTGKSTILKHLIVQDMLAGKGLAFIDPHGDAAEEILTFVPKNRTEDVIYFSPGEMDYPLGLNLFEFETEDQKDFLIQEAINMLYKLYDPQHQGIMGPIYEHWFRNAALAVMADPNGGSFIDIPKLFLDKAYMREKLQHVSDPTVLDFWNKEMVQTSEARRGEVLGWFVSKFGAFASNELMRNIVGQVKSSLNLRDIMDNGKILVVNLSKGRVGELNAMLLGMIFVTKFQAAAMSRANIQEAQRRDFTLYVDEFQSFSTDSFATILSEARKFHLSLIVANQYIAQLEEQVREAVFGNTGTIISFRSGPNDADFLVKQFAPAFEARDLVNMPNLQAAVRLMVGGLPTQPFSMQLLPFMKVINPQLAVALKQLSSAKYGRPRAVVEAEIVKRLESKPAASPFEGLGMGPLGTSPFGPMPPPAGLPTSPPGGTQPPAPRRRSFLDEWLARRRPQAAADESRRRPETAPLPSQFPAQPAPPFGSAQGGPTPAPTHPERTYLREEDRLKTTKASEAAASGRPKTVQPPRPGESVMPSQPLSSTTPAADIQIPAAQASTKPHAAGQDTSVPEQLDAKISSLQAATQARRKTSVPTPATRTSKKPPAKIPPLKRGEIYIDEKGIIHQADESAGSTS